jgi:hypothetical protein
VAGFLALLGLAVYRLATPAVEAFSYDLSWYHWLALAGIVGSFAYVKGYRAFQRRLSRQVVKRAQALNAGPGALKGLLAPVYCMGFFGAGRKRQWVMIILTVAMVGLIFAVRLINQPWRGMIDLGLSIAFAWGFAATISYVVSPDCSYTSSRGDGDACDGRRDN